MLSASGSVLLPELLALIMPRGNCCVTTRNDFDPAQFPSRLVEFMRELNGFIC
jgi:hypothetical protein